MKSSPPGVPVWVPIFVALLGVVGVVAGQFVNAWREDRRWRKEQEREEVRWRREKEKESAKLEQEHLSQWRETRIKVYGNYLAAIRSVIDATDEIYKHISRRGENDVELEKAQLHKVDEAHAFTAQIQLVASRPIINLLRANVLVLLLPPGPLNVPIPLHEREGPRGQEIKEEKRKEHMDLVIRHKDSMWRFHHELVDLMREELGIERIQIST